MIVKNIIDECEDYSLLPTNTTLQSKIKIELLNGKIFCLGLGVLKYKWYIHNKHSTNKSIYYVVVSYTQTYEKATIHN